MSRSRAPSVPTSPPRTGLAVSRYDQVAGLLLTSLMVFGCVTLMMFLVWLSSRLVFVTPAVPVTMLEDVGGGGGTGQILGGEMQLEEPSAGEVQQPTEISREETIGLVSSVLAAKAQELDALVGTTTPGKGGGSGGGEGGGIGSGRGKGEGPGTSEGVPAYERWEIRMSAANLDE